MFLLSTPQRRDAITGNAIKRPQIHLKHTILGRLTQQELLQHPLVFTACLSCSTVVQHSFHTVRGPKVSGL